MRSGPPAINPAAPASPTACGGGHARGDACAGTGGGRDGELGILRAAWSSRGGLRLVAPGLPRRLGNRAARTRARRSWLQDLDFDQQVLGAARAAARAPRRALEDLVALQEEPGPAAVDLVVIDDDQSLAFTSRDEHHVLPVRGEVEGAPHHDVEWAALHAVYDRDPARIPHAHPGHALPIGTEERRALAQGGVGGGFAGAQLPARAVGFAVDHDDPPLLVQ